MGGGATQNELSIFTNTASMSRKKLILLNIRIELLKPLCHHSLSRESIIDFNVECLEDWGGALCCWHCSEELWRDAATHSQKM